MAELAKKRLSNFKPQIQTNVEKFEVKAESSNPGERVIPKRESVNRNKQVAKFSSKTLEELDELPNVHEANSNWSSAEAEYRENTDLDKGED